MRTDIKINLLTLIIIALLFSSCLQTPIDYISPSNNIFRLARANKAKIAMSVKYNGQNKIGNQYLFIALPFGKVKISEPAKYFKSIFYQSLSIKGFKPEIVNDCYENCIEISISNFKLNAFDFIFLRKISSNIELVATLKDHKGYVKKQISINESEKAWKKFGFKPQLEYVFEKNARKVGNQIIENL